MNTSLVKTSMFSSLGPTEVHRDYLVGQDGAVRAFGTPLVSVNLPRFPLDQAETSSVSFPRLTTGDLLKAARAAKGLTQGQLAEATGIYKATIVSIEHGTSLPRAGTIQKLCAVLGLDIPELVSRTELERLSRNHGVTVDTQGGTAQAGRRDRRLPSCIPRSMREGVEGPQ